MIFWKKKKEQPENFSEMLLKHCADENSALLDIYEKTIEHNGQLFMFTGNLSLSDTEKYEQFRSIDGLPCTVYMKDNEVLTDEAKIQQIKEKYSIKGDIRVYGETDENANARRL